MNHGKIAFWLTLIADTFLLVAATSNSDPTFGIYLALVIIGTVFAIIDLSNRTKVSHILAWFSLIFGLGGLLVFLVFALILISCICSMC